MQHTPRTISPTQPLVNTDIAETVSVGYGVATGHCGELFQGQIGDGTGRLRRCLMSLPCPVLFSQVTFEPALDGAISVEPRHKYKVHAVIRETLEYLNAPYLGGRAFVESNICEGKGYGSSTADCVAAVRAVADACECDLSSEDIALLAVRAETASDNSMFDQAVLFAHREGIVLEDYARPIPRLEVLGIDTDRQGIVDTLTYPPATYSPADILAFETFTSGLRRAIRTGDTALLGRVATACAVINQRFLTKSMFREIQEIATRIGALGVAAAHSGTIVSILLETGRPDLEATVDRGREMLAAIGITDVLRYRTPGSRVMRTTHDHRTFRTA
jgi:uncharacterized protein involved in propanediol utilization